MTKSVARKTNAWNQRKLECFPRHNKREPVCLGSKAPSVLTTPEDGCVMGRPNVVPAQSTDAVGRNFTCSPAALGNPSSLVLEM